MFRCDLTGISCEAREELRIPGNPVFWVAPTVKMLLIGGKTIPEIRKIYADLYNKFGAMSENEKKEFFAGSTVKVE